MIDIEALAARADAVVIGGSAGGVDALAAVLPSLSPSSSVPVFIVLHLPRKRASQLAELFAAVCARPVREPLDKEPIEPGVVYVAPPDYHMLVDAGPQIALSMDDLVHFSRPAIDVLFESAADLYGERLLAIVLTGANDDGADGLRAVHCAGGVCVVQEAQGAVAPYMPLSALQRVPTAHVASLSGIAKLLSALG